jgi:hypothetical protein
MRRIVMRMPGAGTIALDGGVDSDGRDSEVIGAGRYAVGRPSLITTPERLQGAHRRCFRPVRQLP